MMSSEPAAQVKRLIESVARVKRLRSRDNMLDVRHGSWPLRGNGPHLSIQILDESFYDDSHKE